MHLSLRFEAFAETGVCLVLEQSRRVSRFLALCELLKITELKRIVLVQKLSQHVNAQLVIDGLVIALE